MTSLDLPWSIECLGKKFQLPSMSTCSDLSQINKNNNKSGYFSTTSLLARILTTSPWRILSLVEIYSNHARQPDQVRGRRAPGANFFHSSVAAEKAEADRSSIL